MGARGKEHCSRRARSTVPTWGCINRVTAKNSLAQAGGSCRDPHALHPPSTAPELTGTAAQIAHWDGPRCPAAAGGALPMSHVTPLHLLPPTPKAPRGSRMPSQTPVRVLELHGWLCPTTPWCCRALHWPWSCAHRVLSLPSFPSNAQEAQRAPKEEVILYLNNTTPTSCYLLLNYEPPLLSQPHITPDSAGTAPAALAVLGAQRWHQSWQCQLPEGRQSIPTLQQAQLLQLALLLLTALSAHWKLSLAHICGGTHKSPFIKPPLALLRNETGAPRVPPYRHFAAPPAVPPQLWALSIHPHCFIPRVRLMAALPAGTAREHFRSR